MQLQLKQKPKGATLVEGFPGFGLIGTITTEFLIDQLNAECIGTVTLPELPAMAAIHDTKLVQPIGIFYDKKNNLLILHIIMPIHGIEWKLAEVIRELCKILAVAQVISVEGVNSAFQSPTPRSFYYADAPMAKRFEKLGVQQLREGIILGLTGALLLSDLPIPYSCVFVETHSTLPDSKAAAQAITLLNTLFTLKLDTKPLLVQAERFEQKLRGIIEKGQMATAEQEKKKLSYVG